MGDIAVGGECLAITIENFPARGSCQTNLNRVLAIHLWKQQAWRPANAPVVADFDDRRGVMLCRKLADFGVHVGGKSELIGTVFGIGCFQIRDFNVAGADPVENGLIAFSQRLGGILPARTFEMASVDLFNGFFILAVGKSFRVGLSRGVNPVAFSLALVPAKGTEATHNDDNCCDHTNQDGARRFLHVCSPFLVFTLLHV